MMGIKGAAALAVFAVHVVVILRAMLVADREPYARTAWLFVLIALPGLGVALYFLFGERWISSNFHSRARQSYEDLLPYAPQLAEGIETMGNPFRTFEAASRWPVSTGNTAIVASGSDAAIAMIVADIDAAAQSVHLSVYIWLSDHNGTLMVDAICRAARRGIPCRVVADAMGSRPMIRSPHWRAMSNAGAVLCASLAAPFGMGFLAGHRIDLRNHRKIVVIDGSVTYCGSQNLADAAFLIKSKFAPWVDIMIRYEGPVARQADLIFASAWNTEMNEKLFPMLPTGYKPASGKGFNAIAAGTGPLSPRGTMSEMFVSLLEAARESATITTPYFAPDPPLIAAIVAAARRGVQVSIVFPRRNDNRIVGAIGRAYYPVLAAAGVRIFEFCGGLLHAKTIVVDGEWGLVGSSNMDRRSLDLNFENNILFESADLSRQVVEHQHRWLTNAIKIDHEDIKARSITRRLLDNSLTMVAAVF